MSLLRFVERFRCRHRFLASCPATEKTVPPTEKTFYMVDEKQKEKKVYAFVK
jgi:hypothetical protein